MIIPYDEVVTRRRMKMLLEAMDLTPAEAAALLEHSREVVMRAREEDDHCPDDFPFDFDTFEFNTDIDDIDNNGDFFI